MSRIAVIADIHANPPALQAVVEDIRRAEVDEVLVGGDLVGRGPHGTRIVRRIRELGWRTIRGNHEDYLLSFRERDVPDEWLVADVWAASRWMANELDEAAAQFIDSLPFTLVSETEPQLRVFHGSPRSYNEGIGDWTSQETLREHFESIDESLLVCAHTHRPIEREVGQGLVVNVGSVGLPFNGDWRAQYVIFERRQEAGWQVEFRQVPYDRERFLEIYRESGFLEEGGITAQVLEMEVRDARPYLVPFLKWADIEEVEPTERRLEEFLDFYDADESMGSFFKRMKARQRD